MKRTAAKLATKSSWCLEEHDRRHVAGCGSESLAPVAPEASGDRSQPTWAPASGLRRLLAGILLVMGLGAVSAVPAHANNAPTGLPTISGVPGVGETLTASAAGIADADGVTGAAFAWQWVANDGTADTGIAGATAAAYTLTSAEVGKTIKVRVTFTDDGGTEETLVSEATVAVKPPLTASFSSVPESHDGSTGFTLDLHFSEGLPLSFRTLRDTALEASGGEVRRARRLAKGSNIGWRITVRPDTSGDVTVALPARACDATGAICTADDRALSEAVSATVPGPASQPREVSISAAGNSTSRNVTPSSNTVTEGTAAVFTLTRTGSLTSALTVTVDVSETGTMLKGTPATAVTFAAESATAELSVETEDDEVAESASVVTAALAAGSGYSTDANASSATVTVEDDDAAPVVTTASPIVAPENGVSIATLTATDDDTAVADLVWSIAGGADQNKVTLSTSGVLAFQAAKDFGAPDDANGDGDYEVMVRVTDGANPVETALTIRLSDVDEAAPVLSSASVADRLLTLTFDESLDGGSTPGPGAFVVKTDGVPHAEAISSVSVNGSTVSLALSYSLSARYGTYGTAVKVSYTAPTGANANPLQDAAGNPVTGFSDQAVTIVATPGQNTPSLGLPSISGTAQVGATLTASASDVADVDGLTNAAFAWQWIANDGTTDANIAGATAETYTLTSAEEGKTIKVLATFTDDGGTEETLLSAATAAVAAEDEVLPTLLWTPTLTIEAQAAPAFRGYSLATRLGGVSEASFEYGGATYHLDMLAWYSGRILFYLPHYGDESLSDLILEWAGETLPLSAAARTASSFTWGQTWLDANAASLNASAYATTLPDGGTGVVCLRTAEQTCPSTTIAVPTIAVPKINVSDANAIEGDSLEFTVSLSETSSQQVTVEYATSGGLATSGTDFTAASGTLTFAPGESSKTVSVATTDDSDPEENERFTLTLSSPTNATLGDGMATGWIIDNDSGPFVNVADASATEGDSLEFTVSLSEATSQQVTVNYRTDVVGTSSFIFATSGTDFTAMSGTLTFAANETSKTVSVPTIDDSEYEVYEIFRLILSSPTNAVLGDVSATGTIIDDDSPLGAVSDTQITMTEGGNGATYTVQLNGQPDGDVTVAIEGATGGGQQVIIGPISNQLPIGPWYLGGVRHSSLNVSSERLTFTTSNWNVPQTVNLTVEDDNDAAHEIITLSHTASGGGYDTAAIPDVTVTVWDDEWTAVVVSRSTDIHKWHLLEGLQGGRATYGVRLSTPPGAVCRRDEDVTITIGGWEGTDLTVSPSTVTIPPGPGCTTNQLVELFIAHDPDDTDDRVTLTHTVSGPGYDYDGGGRIRAETVEIVIRDDDNPNTTWVSIAPPQGSLTEGDTAVFTLTRTGDVAAALTASVQASESGEMADTELPAGFSVTFPAGSATAELSIATEDDEVAEDASDIKVYRTADNTMGYLFDPDEDYATVTVEDDDAAPVLSSATAIGDRLTLTFSKSLDGNSAPGASAFAATVDGNARSVDAVAVQDDTVTLTLASAVASGETVTVSYTVPTGANASPLRDAAGNPVAGFSDQAVTIETPAQNTPPTGLPSISGTAQVGATLTASASGIADEDGLTNATFGWQWIANDGTSDADIAGATAETYTPTAAESGKTLKVRATFTDDGGTEETLLSAATAQVAAALPVVSITAASSPLTEGEAASFTLSRTGDTAAGLTVSVTVSEAGSVLSGTPASTVTIAAGDAEATLSVATDDDSAAEADGRVTATISAGTGYAVNSDSASAGVDVYDNDEAASTAVETLWTSTLTVQDIGGAVLGYMFGNGLNPNGWSEDGAQFRVNQLHYFAQYEELALTLSAGVSDPEQLTLHLDDLRVELSGVSGERFFYWTVDHPGWQAGQTVAVKLTRADPEAAVDAGPELSVADTQVHEAEGAVLSFPVTLAEAQTSVVTVRYATADGTATAGTDYVSVSGALRFAPGETAKTVTVPVLNDAHDEGRETLTLALSRPFGAALADGEATGTIMNTDPMPQAWLTRFGRTVGSQVVDAVTARLDNGGGSHVTVGGVSLGGSGSPPAEISDWNEWDTGRERRHVAREIGERELLLGSSFQLSSGERADGGSAFTAWGRVASDGFEGDDDVVDIDGDVTTAFIGFDAEWDRALAGLLLSQSRGEGSYVLDTELGNDRGNVESDLTGVYPYARLAMSDRVSVWGVAGIGGGELTLHQEGGTPADTDLTMRMGAVGVKGTVLDGAGRSGLGVNVKSDAMWVRTEADGAEGFESADGEVTRLRLVLEGERGFATGDGATLTPSGRVGLRHDGGDAETGIGVEMGAGIRYTTGALTVEGHVRALVAHEASGYEEWGASGAMRVSPDASGRGLTLTLAPTWGSAASATERLWSGRDVTTALAIGDEAEAEGRLEATIGYGMPVLGGRFTGTPELGLGLSERGRDWRLGWRLGLAGSGPVAFDLGAEATRREPANGDAPENRFALTATMRW